ncbi:MAG TPA: hypothetical protein VGL42_11190 [Opitutaceae bacterium]
MKSFLKGLIPATCLLMALPLANAQSGDQSQTAPPPPPAEGQPPPLPPAGGPQGHWRHRADPLASVTNLTDGQKAQIKSIRDAMRAKIEALPDDDDKRQASREIMKSSMQQIRALLTPEQQTQFDAAMKGMRGHRPPPPPDANGEPPAPPPQPPSAPPAGAPSS